MSDGRYTLSFKEGQIKATFVSLPLLIVPLALFWLVFGVNAFSHIFAHNFLVLAAVFFAGLFAHEVLHVAGFRWFGRVPAASTRVGYNARYFTPYATTTEPMPVRGYRLATALPGIVLGLLPIAAGFALTSSDAIVFGAVFLSSAGGDALILWLIRGLPARTLVEDAPDAIGCRIVDNS